VALPRDRLELATRPEEKKLFVRHRNKADYKDLKEKPTKLFRDKNVEGMSDDAMSKVGDFKVEKYKNGGAVKGYGKARGAKACKML
jgi:hypothetical protein